MKRWKLLSLTTGQVLSVAGGPLWFFGNTEQAAKRCVTKHLGYRDWKRWAVVAE